MTDSYRAARSYTSRSRRQHGCLAALAAAAALCLAQVAYAEGDRTAAANAVEFNIPAQPVPTALSAFAKQARVQLFFITDGFEGVEANPVIGTYGAQQALDLLLAGTGLTASISDDANVKVHRVPVAAGSSFVQPQRSRVRRQPTLSSDDPQSGADVRQPSPERKKTERRQDVPKRLEEIVVTGTSIRGVIPESTPLEIFDAADIRNTGALTAEQFIATLPQNNNTLTEISTGASSRESNAGATSSIDLRGLGVGTTLVLLNGRRVAPSSRGRAVDLSFIPLEAVDRIEVLTDGASAIYGTDAVGGVVNFVLKDEQDGAQTVVSLGGAEGGNEVLQIDQSFGHTWNDGSALLALGYMDRNHLDAADRSFSKPAAPFSLIPEDTRQNLLLTGSHEFPIAVTVSGDLLLSTRKPRTVRRQGLANRILDTVADHEQLAANLQMEKAVGDSHHASLLLTYSEASSDLQTTRTPLGAGTSGTNYLFEESAVVDVTATLDGQLLQLPWRNNALYALGVGHASDEFDQLIDATDVGGPIIASSSERDTGYAFAELLVPLVSGERDIHGIHRLEASLAARYTNYSDFGDKTTPKFGLLWAPMPSLRIRSTVGESFKAPFLFQTEPASSTYLLFQPASLGFPDIWTPDGSAVMLMARGTGNPNLGPEESETLTFGFDFDLAALSVVATYFSIDYTDRLAEPDPSGFVSLLNPQDFSELFDVNPSLGEVTEVITTLSPSNLTNIDVDEPGAVHEATTVFFDNRVQNLSLTDLDALDLSIQYSRQTGIGAIDLGVRASRIFGFDERARVETAAISRVNTVLFPVDLKARAHVGLQREGWSARLNLNYVDEYANPFDDGNPTVDAWTTLDLVFSREFTTRDNGWLNDVRLGLVIRNMLDDEPPFVALGPTTNAALNEPVGFDPANSSPVGRFISLQVSKEW